MIPQAAERAQDRRPWTVVLGAFIGTGVSYSPAFLIPFGLYLKPMSAELGWTRSRLSLGIAIISLVAVVLTPIAGALIDRIGSRPLAWSAVVAMPIALLSLSLLPPLFWVYVLLAVFLGVVSTLASPLIYTAVLPQWGDMQLGRAIALSMVGLGVGQILNSFNTGFLIGHFGWRGAWALSAVIIGPIGIANCAYLFRDNKAFVAARRSPGVSPALSGHAFQEALRHPAFWLLAVSAMLVCTVSAGLAVHIASILTDRAASLGTAALASVLLGLGSLAGRLVTGIVLDRVRFGIVGAVSFILQALGVSLLLAGWNGPAPMISVFLVGVATGAEADIIPFALRRRFGMRAFGKLYGLVFALFQLGAVFGPPLLAASFDRRGSYAPMLAIFICFSLVSSLLIVLAGRVSAVTAPLSGIDREQRT